MLVIEATGETTEVGEVEAIEVVVVGQVVNRSVVHAIRQATSSASVRNGSAKLVETKAMMVGLQNAQNTND